MLKRGDCREQGGISSENRGLVIGEDTSLVSDKIFVYQGGGGGRGVREKELGWKEFQDLVRKKASRYTEQCGGVGNEDQVSWYRVFG